MLKESETIEFKKSTAELKSGVASIAAILNKHGKGKLYFGIKDDGTIVGQAVGRDTVKQITQTIVDNIEPKIYPKITAKEIKDKRCIVVEFHGNDAPYFAYGRAYIRVGESDKQLSIQEMEKRFIHKNKLLWDGETSDKKLKDVNIPMLKEYMKKANEAKRINFKYTNAKATLNKLWLLKRNKLTRAAEVLFCDDNRVEIQAAVFAGTDKLTFLDIRQFKGNLFSLREQAENYIKEHIKWRAEMKESRRKEIPEIPVRAFSEAVGNSLCHRDYTNPKGNEVAIFKDRVEVYNPGKFPENVNPEDFIKGDMRSILRNPLIAETMYKSADIERWGSGLKRIYEECTASQIEFEFKRIPMGFVVVFYRPKWEEGEGLVDSSDIEEGLRKIRKKTIQKTTQKTIQKTTQKTIQKTTQKTIQKTTQKQNEILAYLKNHPTAGRKKIATKIKSITEAGVQYNLKVLREKGLLKRIGPAKGGHWKVCG